MEQDLMIPEDLRSAKKNGRPSNEERSSANAIREQIHLLSADLLKDLRSDIKRMSPAEKSNLLGKLLSHISDDEGKSIEDASFEILAEKYLKIEMRVKGVGGISTTKSKGTAKRNAKAGKDNA